MAVTADPYAPVASALATTCTLITPGSGVNVVWFSCDAACYLVYSTSLADGGTLPSNAYFLIPAGVLWPIKVKSKSHGRNAFIAAVSGTPTGHFLGEEG